MQGGLRQSMHHLSEHSNVVRIHDTYEDTAFMEACHWLGVMHRDLKPKNFLFDTVEEGAKVKTTDFGLSVFYKPGLVALSLDLVFVEDAEGRAWSWVLVEVGIPMMSLSFPWRRSSPMQSTTCLAVELVLRTMPDLTYSTTL
ncbi:hypothetical protein GYH30_006904 [Glycine max]|nr:hypothetical protein GYH30_006904 [Glycine max]